MKNKAYKLGFNHGYKEGVENNPYEHPCKKGCDHDNQKETYFWDYREGYDNGVKLYCEEEE